MIILFSLMPYNAFRGQLDYIVFLLSTRFTQPSFFVFIPVEDEVIFPQVMKISKL